MTAPAVRQAAPAIRPVEVCAAPGDPLATRLVDDLRARGFTVEAVERPSKDGSWIDLAVGRSADGIHPPAPFTRPRSPGVVVSSTLAFHPSERHIGMAEEGWGRAPRGSLAADWRAFETASTGPQVAILRAAPCPIAGGRDPWSRWLGGRVVPSALGFDPCLQLLDPRDLGSALAWALGEASAVLAGTVTHVVPTRPVFVRRAIAARGARRVALPTALLRRGALGAAADVVRFPITAAGDRAAAVGWRPRHSSRQAAAALGGGAAEPAEDDDFGLDRRYVGRFERTLFRFLHDAYWRVAYRGLEHLPKQGAAVLVGVHRGFMPWDGVMMLVGCHRQTGRYVRFLAHPALLKLPVLTPFMNKLGGVVACRENAERLLARGDLVGIFPEGIRGAFKRYRTWHRVGRFGRATFVRLAIRHGVPIVPFATVGSAEIFPIWGKIEIGWWRRWAEWPFVPITTPVPLPSKWHTEVLPPIDVAAGHRPEAADDPAVVEAVSREVRSRLQAAIDRLRAARRWLFFGNLDAGWR